MFSDDGKDPRDWLIIVCIVSAIVQALHWFIAAGPILYDSREGHFLAEKDPGSFLVPAACLYFRGTENKDFVRGHGARPFGTLCWYTRGAFRSHFPELQAASEAESVRKQVERMKIGVFRQEQAEANLTLAARRSLHMGLISLMLIAFFSYLARNKRDEDGDPPAKGRWHWRRRGRWYFGR
jgi:hypothetical protein